jgi:protein-S-isoprenylcysteine O-methyltransferase Ste14
MTKICFCAAINVIIQSLKIESRAFRDKINEKEAEEKMTAPALKSHTNVETTRGILRWARQIVVMTAVFGAVLFLCAGKLNWPPGWAYLGINILSQALSAIVLIPRQPGMLSERSKVREGTKGWDRVLTPLIVLVGTLAVMVVAGLDARFGWSEPYNPILWGSGIVLAFASQLFVLWAMASNPFFAATVRIQDDRGHSVVSQGPYGIVRHPGYAGSLFYNLFIPLVLGSTWVYLPVLITLALLVLRTSLEDRTLRTELPGYAEYGDRVRYRLIPGVW